MKKGFKYGCLAIVAIWGIMIAASFIYHSIKGDTGNKTEEQSAETKDSIVYKMHFYYGAEDTTSLVSMQKKLQELCPDATELDTINGYLSELREKYTKLQAEWKVSFDKLKVKKDEFENTIWYENPYFTHSTFSNNVSLYIGRKGDKIWPCAKISYTGSDWIFFEEITFLIGQGTFTFTFNKHKDRETEVSGGRVAEWVNMSIDQYPFSYIADIPEFDNAKIRMSGKYTHDRAITNTEKKAIQEVVNGYRYLLSTGCEGMSLD